MKIIGKIFLTVSLLLLLMASLSYYLLQTTWASSWFSQWISQRTPYQISVKKIDHFWAHPMQFNLRQVTFSDHKTHISADKVLVSFNWRQWFENKKLDTLALQNGKISTSIPLSVPFSFNQLLKLFPIQTKILTFNEMTVHIQGEGWKIEGENLKGGWIALKSSLNHDPTHGIDGKTFQFSLRSLNINDILAQNLFIQGEITKDSLKLNNFGASLAQGDMTGSAVKTQGHSWQLKKLRLSNIRLQTQKTLKEFWGELSLFSPVELNDLQLINNSFEGNHWVMNEFNLTLKKMRFQNGDWQSDDGKLSFNAANIISGDFDFKDPVMQLNFSSQGVNIEKFSTYWKEGLLKGKGVWVRADSRLALEELSIDNLVYPLPWDWRKLWKTTLPSWISQIDIQKFTANRNLFIDVSPEFPFQITSLNGFGEHLQLAKNHEWGMYSGSVTLNAPYATFNKNDIRHLSVEIEAQPTKLTIKDLSGLTQKGILQAHASLSQTPDRLFSLTLQGQSVDLNILHNWGWPTLPISGAGNLQLNIKGHVAPDIVFKNSLTGALKIKKDNQEKINQVIKKGKINTL